ncbi:MAG: DUF2332 domain-containing protein [Planctomycetes bacterium]|nr:DUF2332 domain-containing protein [Planctomycetota bacterium]
MTLSRDELARTFERFGDVECRGYGPLYERLSPVIAKDAALLDLAANAGSTPVPNLLFAAVHYLLLGGLEHELANFYPTVLEARRARTPAPQLSAEAAFADFCRKHESEIIPLLRTRRTQTNEVRRCALLLPAYARVAKDSGRALALVEIGAAAGFNLLFDRYSYVYGTQRCTAPGSRLALKCELRGNPVEIPTAPPQVAWRRGLDLNPIDIDDSDAVRWLQALIWPEHVERMARLNTAIEIARVQRSEIVGGDALKTLPEAISHAPGDAALCVVHSFTLNQFSKPNRETLEKILRKAATKRPVYRLGVEGADPTVLQWTRYEGAHEKTAPLAHCQPHGEWLEWLA